MANENETLKMPFEDETLVESFEPDGQSSLVQGSISHSKNETVPTQECTSSTNSRTEVGKETMSFEHVFSRIRWGRIALAAFFAFLVLAAALFAWNRWYRFDDALDIQGMWRNASSGATMEVNAEYIKLSDNAVYEYTIDTAHKRIVYTFGDDTGFSSYRFSEDRTQLVLEDNVETDWALVMHFYDDPGFAEGSLPEGITRLEKVSSEVPDIKPPGSSRPKSPLDHGPSSKLIEEEKAKHASKAESSHSDTAGSSSGEESQDEVDEKPKASQTVPDENGLVVSPDRNAKGYYDENGIFVAVSYGHFDENGDWVDDVGGYYDASGNWIEGPSGYYDASGMWVLYNGSSSDSVDTQTASGSESASGEGYYDQYGNWVALNALPDTPSTPNATNDTSVYENAGTWEDPSA